MMSAPPMQPKNPWRLISLPTSHFCEKVRWGLERLGLPYVEEPHLLLLHRKVTQPLGGTSVPVLVTHDRVLTDSTEILRYLDLFAPLRARLYPRDVSALITVESLEVLFNQILGPEISRWFYFCLLERADILKYCFCEGLPEREIAVYSRIKHKIQLKVQENLKLSADSAEEALTKIYQVFERVESFLSDGRPYLLGDSMTAADITLAALAAPLVLPPEYPIARGFSLPRSMVQEVVACRTTLTGEFVLRMYRQDRYVNGNNQARSAFAG